MEEISRLFLDESRRYLCVVYLADIERAVAPLTDEQVWWRPNEEANSIGNLVLHLTGNVRQWIVGGVGKLPNERHRQQEFDQRQVIARGELLARLRRVIEEADAVLSGLDEANLHEHRTIQGSDLTVAGAIYHVVEHFSGHTGQILWIAKSMVGKL